MPKPIDQLTKLERLREIVALQRLSAASGFDNVHRTDLEFLRKPNRINATVYMFRDRGGYDGMIEYYFQDALKTYDEMKRNWKGEGPDFQRLVRDRGLTNVVNYRLEKRKRG